jgi:3-hydroxymyristoyl/3-hydroxydecanoyl-(acyl carrier protein) dehydratase
MVMPGDNLTITVELKFNEREMAKS